MKFGRRVKALRKTQHLTQRELAERLDVSVSYISKVENERLHFGDFPSGKFIHKLADVLEADEEELMLLADKIPTVIRKRVRERPDAFRTLAGLDDAALDNVIAHAEKVSRTIISRVQRG